MLKDWIADTPTYYLDAIESVHRSRGCKPNDQHKAKIFHSLVRDQAVTRTRLAHELGLRTSTVSRLTHELVTQGLAYEHGRDVEQTTGRPGRLLRPNLARLAIVAVYCVSLEFRAVLVNLGEEILTEASAHVDTESGNYEIAETIVDLTEQVKAGAPSSTVIIGLSMTVPGSVDTKGKRWLFAARWQGLRNLDFAETEQRCGLEFHVSRAIDAELSYLMHKHPHLKEGNTLLLHWGFGIGGAFSSDGHVVAANSGAFCQIGHARIRPTAAKRCVCGQVGCLETEAALWAILPQLRKTYSAVPEQEHSFADFIDKTEELYHHPCIQNAIEAVGDATQILMAVLVPRRVLIYGPFINDQRILTALATRATDSTPGFFANTVEILPLHNGFLGSVYAECSRIFLDTLHRTLKAGSADFNPVS